MTPRKHNPFAAKEASILQSPWGEFEVAAPNKARLAEIAALQKDAAVDDLDPMRAAEMGLRSVAAGLVNGGDFLEKALEAWDAGTLTLDQIRGAAEFVSEEIQGEVAAGNA